MTISTRTPYIGADLWIAEAVHHLVEGDTLIDNQDVLAWVAKAVNLCSGGSNFKSPVVADLILLLETAVHDILLPTPIIIIASYP